MAFARQIFEVPLPSGLLRLGERTLLMGVLNVNRDSFYGASRVSSMSEAVEKSHRIQQEGADLLDVGGESTRPGAEPVPLHDELDRVLPVVEALRGKLRIPISIDTYKAEVARRAVEAGAEVINDISAGRFDPEMIPTVARLGVPLILMHLRGEPKTMQHLPRSSDILREVITELGESSTRAQKAGVHRDRILIDPGIGFGKSLDDNLTLLKHLPDLAGLSHPIVVGSSRKGFTGPDRPPEERLFATAATVAAAILHGAHVVRVHDVSAMREVARMADSILLERRLD
ncbi:MAG: dihydropteroate synthase [Acidobacteria bacterium]|nr:dihydropteroate synthase [Acidobacteriota bacterium]